MLEVKRFIYNLVPNFIGANDIKYFVILEKLLSQTK